MSGGYRSSRLRPAEGAVVLAPRRAPGERRRRLVNAALDIAALPLVAAGPRREIALLGERVPLHYEWRRWTWRSERCLEIGLGKRALAAHDPSDVLEVGNVMALAGVSGQTVVDKYEAGEGVLNEDIVDYAPGRTFRLVLSLSTLEHVGWDEEPRDEDKAGRALVRLGELAGGDGSLLVTIPVGVHRRLEEAFVGAASPFGDVTMFVKTGRRARWEPRPVTERGGIAYGRPYANGNAVLVGVRGTPLRG